MVKVYKAETFPQQLMLLLNSQGALTGISVFGKSGFIKKAKKPNSPDTWFISALSGGTPCYWTYPPYKVEKEILRRAHRKETGALRTEAEFFLNNRLFIDAVLAGKIPVECLQKATTTFGVPLGFTVPVWQIWVPDVRFNHFTYKVGTYDERVKQPEDPMPLSLPAYQFEGTISSQQMSSALA